ncbi:hypothetical protein QTO05_05700 [Vibrio fortis]|uniref:hypothetical protein n=1 Tax=Vibrio fortis TaxID=212667 RepID=UPI002F428000
MLIRIIALCFTLVLTSCASTSQPSSRTQVKEWVEEHIKQYDPAAPLVVGSAQVDSALTFFDERGVDLKKVSNKGIDIELTPKRTETLGDGINSHVITANCPPSYAVLSGNVSFSWQGSLEQLNRAKSSGKLMIKSQQADEVSWQLVVSKPSESVLFVTLEAICLQISED